MIPKGAYYYYRTDALLLDIVLVVAAVVAEITAWHGQDRTMSRHGRGWKEFVYPRASAE